MKTFLLLPLVLAVPAFAGTSAKQVIAPAPDPCIMSWFAGASVGYLTDLQEPMYNVHVGVTNSCWTIAGWNTALYLEVGYVDHQEDYRQTYQYGTTAVFTGHRTWENDVTIVPLTLNVKFDRVLTGNLSAYVGGGLGAAYINDDLTFTQTFPAVHASVSDSSWVFCAQIFAGLSYKVSPSCEIYGGGRWIYLADPKLGGSTISIGDDWLLELGARFKF